MTRLFPSRYPIVEAIMNIGSTVSLAAAVAEAGAFPSLYLYHRHEKFDPADSAYEILKEFTTLNGNGNVLVNISVYDLLDDDFFTLINDFKISHIELWGTTDKHGNLLDFDSVYRDPCVQQAIKKFRSVSKILARIRTPITSQHLSMFDAICVKGLESAGVTGDWPVKKLLLHQKNIYPDQSFIPYGGVGTPEQVKDYMDLGSPAVAVGTLFAMTAESSLSTEAKNSLLQKAKQGPIRTQDTKQNVILFDDRARDIDQPHEWNRNQALRQGITGTGQQGLVYAGQAIKQVDSIRTVKETVEYLVQLLDQ